MSEARKRIEEMEKRLRVIYNCLKRMSGGRRISEILKAFDRETEKAKRIAELEAEVERLREEFITVCRWTPLDEDCPGAYETACNHAYQFEDGWLKDNTHTKYCPFCGGRIEEDA